MNKLFMDSAFLVKIKKFELRGSNIPVPGKKEVLIRIKNVGICGSDMHYYRYGRIGSTLAKLPYVIGHECAGVVEKNGTGSRKFKPGTRVIVEPAIPCGKCRFCRAGWINLCPAVKFLGTPPVSGAYSRYIIMPEQNLIKMPENMSFDEAVMTEPLSVGVHAVNMAGMSSNHSIAIFGCGPIGLCILLIAKAKGVKTIFVTDKLEYKLKLAKKIGATYAINPDKTNPVKFIQERTGGLGINRSFEAAGDIKAMSESIESVYPGGTAVLAGIPVEDNIKFNAHTARRKGVTIKLLRRSNKNTEEAIKLISKYKVNVNPLVTHHFNLADIEKGFKLLSNYSGNVVKIIINP